MFAGLVGGTKWSNNVFVQVYGQFEDPDNPGNYVSFTCNSEFRKDQDFSTTNAVRSFIGSSSLETSQNRNVKWNAIALSDEQDEEEAIWTIVAGDDEVNYRSLSPSKKNCW